MSQENAPGRFFVIEGTDGSGKTEQAKRLEARLERAGFPVEAVSFPQYGKPSAYFVERYLRGEYGNMAAATDPRAASLFFALDRFDAAVAMREAMRAGKMLIANRYVASNMGHQGGKVPDAGRKEFFRWLFELEYGILNIPKPDLNIILHVPAEVAQQLVGKKVAAERAYTKGAVRDLHERDLEHLRAAEQVYLAIAKFFPDEFTVVECMDGDRLMSMDEVEERVWAIIQPLIAK